MTRPDNRFADLDRDALLDAMAQAWYEVQRPVAQDTYRHRVRDRMRALYSGMAPETEADWAALAILSRDVLAIGEMEAAWLRVAADDWTRRLRAPAERRERMRRLLSGELAPVTDADLAALRVLCGRARCGCVYHAREGIPCEHDMELARRKIVVERR